MGPKYALNRAVITKGAYRLRIRNPLRGAQVHLQPGMRAVDLNSHKCELNMPLGLTTVKAGPTYAVKTAAFTKTAYGLRIRNPLREVRVHLQPEMSAVDLTSPLYTLNMPLGPSTVKAGPKYAPKKSCFHRNCVRNYNLLSAEECASGSANITWCC